MAKGTRHLEYFERELIAELRFDGESIGYIAEIIGRSKSTISDELRRNSRDGRYNPAIAEALARKRAATPKITDKMDCPPNTGVCREKLEKAMVSGADLWPYAARLSRLLSPPHKP